MRQAWSRRQMLKASAAAGLGLTFPMPFIGKSHAAGIDHRRRRGRVALRKILWRARGQPSPRRPASTVAFNSIPHDNIRQQFALDAMSAAGGFDVYIADQPWLPEFAEKGFIIDLTDKVDAADKADFAGRALDTVSWGGKLYALPIIVHNCAMYYRSDLLERGRALRRPGDLGRVSRMGEEAHQGRRLRHADRRQAGHRGDDASPLLHPAGGRRHPRRQQQAGLRFRCRPRGAASSC